MYCLCEIHYISVPLICSFPKELTGLLWGDKDTFGIAFAAAGKAHLYSQVAVPPGMKDSTLQCMCDYSRSTPAVLLPSIYLHD